MKRWLIAFIPIAVIVAILAYVVGSRIIPQSMQDNFANAAAVPETSGSFDDNLANALPEAPLNSQPAEVPAGNAVADVAPTTAGNDAVSAVVPPPPMSAGAGDAGGDPDAEAQARREIAQAIRKATLDALDSGEPAHWHKDGLQGDVAVSEEQDEGQNLNCRTVTATMGADDNRQQSGDHLWCQGDGGDWAPR